MDGLSSVVQLLKKARQRWVIDLVLDQFALAVAIGMGGAIVLLLTGNAILDWYWIALLAIVSLGVGIFRMRGRVPSAYRLAQRIDWKLNLADALSTATYFASDHKPICEQQRRGAEQVARTVDPKIAVPFTRSRFTWPAVGLALVACGLFAVRYAVTGSMSMQPSLVKMAYDTFFGNTPKQQAKNNRKPPVDPNSPVDPTNPDSTTTQQQQTPDEELKTIETPDVNNSEAVDQSKEAAKGQQSKAEDPGGDDGEKGEKGDKSENADQGNQDKKDGAQGDKSKDGKQDAKNQNGNADTSSMLDKLKDAMANMLNKMKSNPSQEQTAKNSQDSKAGAQQKGDQKGQNQKGNPDDSQQADAQGDQQGDQSQSKQSANAKSGDKSQDKNNSPDSKSGIGSSDGDKAAKEAEMLKAMGKISEILGKRSASVSGEVMVEVGQTKQQLKTPWAQKQATHAEAGSEIHRDEVPLMYQQFVQQYFEEIRKGSEAPAKPGDASKPADGKPPRSPSP